MNELTISQLGWVAGILDLKGRVVTKKNQQRATPQYVLMVESKENAVIDRLCALTGTQGEWREGGKLKDWMQRGCIEHCPEKHVHIQPYEKRMPTIGRWQATGAAAGVILFNVIEYIEGKQRFADILPELLKNAKLIGQGSGATVAAINRMHRLGWKIPDEFKDAVVQEEVVW